MDLKDTYNRIAEDWHKDHQQDDWWRAGTEKLISLLKPGAQVLDVGCGGGTKSKYIIAKGLQVSGIDFSESMIEIARREAPQAKFWVLDMREVDTLVGEFDCIFVQAALLHIAKNEVDTVLKKLERKLRVGGYFYIAVKGIREDGIEEEVVKKNNYTYEYERFFSYFTAEELAAKLKNLGLEVVFSETNPSKNTNWIQMIAKK